LRFLLAALLALAIVAPASAMPINPTRVSGSHYAAKFEGRKTACGDRYDGDEFTAASNRHPCDAMVRVSRGDRSVIVRVTDRCGRCGIDLSRAAAREIGLHKAGRSPVYVERIE